MSTSIIATLDRLVAAQTYAHAAVCVQHADDGAAPCHAKPSPYSVGAALDVLDDSPRAATRARVAAHNRVCASYLDGGSCGSDGGVGHAKTQTATVVALRKFRAEEA